MQPIAATVGISAFTFPHFSFHCGELMAGDLNSSGNPNVWRRALVGRNPKRTMIRAACLLVISIVIFKFILLPVRISGISMDPTYRDGRVNFINRLAYLKSDPERYDVVGIRMAGTRVQLFKRVIGLPGETVAIRNGVVFINGEALPEPYLGAGSVNPDWQLEEKVLGPGQYFVVGDNRSMDQRFHEFGIAERLRIVGKVLL
jgi:signal peptidase I